MKVELINMFHGNELLLALSRFKCSIIFIDYFKLHPQQNASFILATAPKCGCKRNKFIFIENIGKLQIKCLLFNYLKNKKPDN